jgi:hypothetical protein
MSSNSSTDTLYRAITRIFSIVIAVSGLAIITVTLANGGGIAATGLWLGLGFTGLGVARLYLSMRHGDE